MLDIRIRLKILEIINLSLEKNNEEKNTIFFNFMGHCSSFCISIHYDGWKNNKEPDYRKNLYFTDLLIKEKLKELDEIMEVLKNLK
jgi:hypothetical protein